MSTISHSQFKPKGIPVHIETNGFKLRSLTPSDVTPHFLNWLNDPGFMAGLNLASIQFSHESLIQFINSFNNFTNYIIGIFDAHHVLIGFYTLDVNRLHKTGNITTGIGESAYEGKGVLWATIDALLDHFFTYCDIDKITARVLANNRRMLFNFLGNPRFVFEAKLYKECIEIGGDRIDLLLFSTFKDQTNLAQAGKSMQ